MALMAPILHVRAKQPYPDTPCCRRMLHRVALALTIAAALMAAGCTSPWGGERAEHRWSVAIDAAGDDTYSVEVPFLTAEGAQPGRVQILDALRERVQVRAGDAELTWVRNGTHLRIDAQGPVEVAAVHSFRGSVEEREAFLSWRMASEEVVRAGQGPAVDVDWAIDFSGGKGHTCWAEAQRTARLDPGDARAPLAGGEGDGRGFPAECA